MSTAHFKPAADQAVGQTLSVPRFTLLRRAGVFLAWTLIFGLAYTQAPLYFSNQNQYFLHGLARAGQDQSVTRPYALLADDWLATTRDPTPAFSTMVRIVASWLHEDVFFAIYVLLLGAYFNSLLGCAEHVFDRPLGGNSRLLLATVLVALHAGVSRWASVRLTGVDYPWYLQAGVAGQYLLGFGLQPSACGVFLLVSVWTFLRDRPGQAAAWACLAATFHATYLLSAGLLVVAYLGSLLWNGQIKRALLVGVAALLMVAPVVGYSLVQFAPSSPAEFAESQYLLSHFRIPHHTQPAVWCDGIALGQTAWIAGAILLVWRTRLSGVMATIFVLSLALTLAQMFSSSDVLALLFPWRSSTLLMPLATAVIVMRFVGAVIPERLGHSPALPLKLACGSVLALCVVGGLAIMVFRLGYHTSPDEADLLAYVRDHKKAGDVYLLPVELPNTAAGPRGAASRNKNFTPPPRRDGKGPHIAVDLQSFRLATGAPIYVDFKSIPYWDKEVMEWKARLEWAHRLFAKKTWDDVDIAELRSKGITHVVAPAHQPLLHEALAVMHEDRAYRLYVVQTDALARR